MLRRRAPEEDSAVLIDMAPGMEKGDSYGSTANTSQVTLHHQGPRVQEAQHSPLAPRPGLQAMEGLWAPTPRMDTGTLWAMACAGPKPLGWMLPGDAKPSPVAWTSSVPKLPGKREVSHLGCCLPR